MKERKFWLVLVRKYLLGLCDFFYPLVATFMPIKTYRYSFFGMVNVLIDNVLFIFFYYVVFYRFVAENIVCWGTLCMGLHTLVLICTTPTLLLVGFFLMRYIVFGEARKKSFFSQLVKYIFGMLSSVLLSYVFLRLFIEWCRLTPGISKILTSGLVIVYSYFFQTRITFHIKNIRRKSDHF